ncbi:MAG: glycine zipper domain-containing protein [Acidobacteriota bacterium]|nr:glycine zipper domain-containing protein [Acidobacteriota bacterium]
MKRIFTTSFALLAMALAPVASFGGDRDQGRACNRDEQGYRSNYPVQSRYDNRGYGYDAYQRNSYTTPRDYNYNYSQNGYGYSNGYPTNKNRWGRSAAYVGGGAAAGAVVGGLIGHGKGAAVGALAGGVGGYLYKKHKDRN